MNIKYILYYCITKTHAEAMYAYGRIFEISATQNNAISATHATQNNAINAINAINATQCNPKQCNQCNPMQPKTMQPINAIPRLCE
jgi:hypothetical protein